MISKVKPVVNDADDESWFETWFDSPFYHILYKHRDSHEAEMFLDALIDFIKPTANSRILDIACGKGRHSIYLNKKGFDVTGFDLSAKSILHDKQFENETLNFYLHDMREVFRSNYFDIVLNLFSSFGYFEKERDNVRSLIAASIALKSDGVFVFDYFNSNRVRDNGECSFSKTIEGINFNIHKIIDEKIVRKDINFSHEGVDYEFHEQLTLFDKEQLEKYFNQAGLAISHCFGNYKLEPYDKSKSDRLILVAKKIIQP